MSNIDFLAKDLAKTLLDAQSKKPTSYDTQAEVRRVEGDTAWVHIPGGVDETPVQLTTNAKKGDVVQVRVSGGRAWLYGNKTAPPTDDTTAKKAEKKATYAEEASIEALDATERIDARVSASEVRMVEVERDISGLEVRVDVAERDITAVEGDISSLGTRVGTAEGKITTVEGDIDSLETRVGTAEVDISVVEGDITTLQGRVVDAEEDIDDTLKGLALAQNVIGTLAWITAHSTVTNDTTPVSGKAYYIKNQDGTFTLVTDTTGKNPHTEGWYEMDEAITNYIAAHLAMTNDGLVVTKDNSKWKVLVKNNGIDIIDSTSGLNRVVASYGSGISFDSSRPFTIGNNNTYITFDPANGGTITIGGGSSVVIGTNKTLDQVLTDLDVSVEQTSSGADITINGDTVSISNGATGVTGATGATGATGDTAEWFYGTDLTHTSGTETLTVSGAVVGSMYLNPDTSLVYKCTNISGSTMTWTYAGDLTTGVIDNIQPTLDEINDTLESHSEIISETSDIVQEINNGFVRWDSTNNRMIQITNPDGTKEITTDFLSGWMQFGLDANDKPTLSLGDNSNMTVNLQPDKLSFCESGIEVAYISNQRLYITQSVVLQQMDVGEKIASGGLGQWSWAVHDTEVNGVTKNNMYLKWLG